MFFFSLALTILGLLLYSVKNEPVTVDEYMEIADEEALVEENTTNNANDDLVHDLDVEVGRGDDGVFDPKNADSIAPI